MNFFPTRSAWIHLRFPFSIFLLPIFLFALSQTPNFDIQNIFLVLITWHLFIYPASNGFNSYFDKDEQSIALVGKPPVVDKSLYNFSIFLQIAGFLLGCLVSFQFSLATLVYTLISNAYSHPAIRLKKYPVVSFVVVFIFQGAFVYWSTYLALSGISIHYVFGGRFVIAGMVSSCLVGASYPITQIYQFEEDSRRGDRTLALLLGYKGSFIFSGILFLTGTGLLYLFYEDTNIFAFYTWLATASPVVLTFLTFAISVWRNPINASFKNVMLFVSFSSLTMLAYFGWLVIDRF